MLPRYSDNRRVGSGQQSRAVAVIVVGHNSSGWLNDCFASIRADRDAGMHLVYVDNASTDDSVEVVRRIGGVHIVWNRHNRGFAAGAHDGACFASRLGADVLFFLNPDTRASSRAIRTCGDVLMADRLLGVIGPLQTEYGRGDPPQFNMWTRRAVRCATTYPLYHPVVNPMAQEWFDDWRRTRADPIPVWYVNGGAFAIRAEVYCQCGGLDRRYFLFFEEVDLCQRVRRLGYAVALLPNVFVEHAWGGHASEVRLQLWLRGKYRFLLSDTTLRRTHRWRLVGEHLVKDVAAMMEHRAGIRKSVALVAWLLTTLVQLKLDPQR
jgi:GT2 family glycosyltransferase